MPAGAYDFRVGPICCTVLSDGYFSYPMAWFFPNADPAELAAALDARRLPHDRILSPFTCLLIETGSHVVLVDTGAGETLTTTGAISARLEMSGIRPRDVTTVVLTHAHSDHIGGAVDSRGRPAFPNARYILSETELDFWTAAHPDSRDVRLPDKVTADMAQTARDCLRILRHQLEPIDGETEIVPGVVAIPSAGHTPGHLALLLTAGGERLLHLGDAAVHPLHLEHPTWHNGFDQAAEQAVCTRRELVERAAKEQMHLMAFHFPFPSVGRVGPLAEGGWEWRPGW
ncbi:MAG TPA: MBL fold metallo-hydrolase [Candidatus Sulfopaludibacter sp.]|jgi:glyoxylase-like metal-dependent hydrolase (beta-lactamase superfamily II)|nr:MBL fold metallo-hydrolase [Candidatus Sulfopaludibacter sp.]